MNTLTVSAASAWMWVLLSGSVHETQLACSLRSMPGHSFTTPGMAELHQRPLEAVCYSLARFFFLGVCLWTADTAGKRQKSDHPSLQHSSTVLQKGCSALWTPLHPTGPRERAGEGPEPAGGTGLCRRRCCNSPNCHPGTFQSNSTSGLLKAPNQPPSSKSCYKGARDLGMKAGVTYVPGDQRQQPVFQISWERGPLHQPQAILYLLKAICSVLNIFNGFGFCFQTGNSCYPFCFGSHSSVFSYRNYILFVLFKKF